MVDGKGGGLRVMEKQTKSLIGLCAYVVFVILLSFSVGSRDISFIVSIGFQGILFFLWFQLMDNLEKK
jgi:hypothetical protein